MSRKKVAPAAQGSLPLEAAPTGGGGRRPPSTVEPLMRRNFIEYASYVIVDRAIPDLRDGCKPVQRRILTTLGEMDDGRFHKVANVIGETMKLHPHGDASIADALVVLANKEYFIERQGNFGNIVTGHPPAAARYIECRLTDLARETLFHKKLTETQPSYDGRKTEPVFLPAKLPVALLIGAEGIAVGMSTRILPHNFCELLEAQIAILRKKKFSLVPDFLQGGLLDASEYDDGNGRVRVRARIEVPRDRKSLTVTEVPYSVTTESLIQSIEGAAQKGKLKVASIEDRTGEQVEIVLHLPRGIYADEVEPQLYAYTQCEVPITPNLLVIDGDRPAELTVTEVLKRLTKRLREQIRAELQLELETLEDRQHLLTLEQIFVEQRVYQRIEKAKTAEAVRREVWEGMQAHADRFVRPMVEADVDRLLEIRIRRISAYDIERNRSDLEEVADGIKACKRKLRRLTDTTVGYLRDLLDKYGSRYPRRTELVSFDTVSKREVARQNLKLAYDPSSGFFGTTVRGDKFQLSASEFDKILAVSADGTYRIVAPPEKLFVGKGAPLVEVFDEDEGTILTVVYRDERRIPWAKKVHIKSFIKDKEYRLAKEGSRVDRVLVGESDKLVHLKYAPRKR
ncbi:MAG: DNA topoisomerase IV subunit A, partial [Thermoanaerobaculia bacterium]|nr:DNA topoisomerase IV subunit A [Thermoanaerobaculia bacterium]